MSGVRVVEVTDAAGLEDIRQLFRDYADWIARDLYFTLDFQGFDAELEALPGGYAPPDGALFLAQDDTGTSVGCIGLRRFDDRSCEVKRLYLKPGARGLGAGRALAQAVLRRAREIGYARALLDTAEGMDAAQKLYENEGFRDIPPYYDNPHRGMRFMALDLTRWRA